MRRFLLVAATVAATSASMAVVAANTAEPTAAEPVSEGSSLDTATSTTITTAEQAIAPLKKAGSSRDAETDGDRHNVVKVVRWSAFHTRKALQDGSSLYSYTAETPALSFASDINDIGHWLRFVFVPRFGCSPLISIVSEIPPGSDNAAIAALMQAYSRSSVTVDGTPVSFSPLVERVDDELHTYLDTDVKRRRTFRIMVEIGAAVTADVLHPQVNNNRLSFSLKGSQKALQESISNCKAHSG